MLFDPATVVDNATFEQPLLPSTGITHVWVNGELAVDGGMHTGVLAGRVLG